MCNIFELKSNFAKIFPWFVYYKNPKKITNKKTATQNYARRHFGSFAAEFFFIFVAQCSSKNKPQFYFNDCQIREGRFLKDIYDIFNGICCHDLDRGLSVSELGRPSRQVKNLLFQIILLRPKTLYAGMVFLTDFVTGSRCQHGHQEVLCFADVYNEIKKRTHCLSFCTSEDANIVENKDAK